MSKKEKIQRIKFKNMQNEILLGTCRKKIKKHKKNPLH